MARAWFVTTLLSSYFLICATVAQAQKYNVSLDFKEPLHASVQATLIVPDGKLFTHGHAGGYEWSDYTKSLHVYRKNGAEIALQPLGHGQWALNAPKDESFALPMTLILPSRSSCAKARNVAGSFSETPFILSIVRCS